MSSLFSFLIFKNPSIVRAEEKAARIKKYQDKIAELNARGVHHPMAIFKALLEYYLQLPYVFSRNHRDYCTKLIGYIDAEKPTKMIALIRDVSQHIASSKSEGVYNEDGDFQAMFDVFMAAYKRPTQERYMQIIQNSESYSDEEFMVAIRSIAVTLLDHTSRQRVISTLFIPLLERKENQFVLFGVMSVLQHFLPIDDNLAMSLTELLLPVLGNLSYDFISIGKRLRISKQRCYEFLAKIVPTHVGVQHAIIVYCERNNASSLATLLPHLKDVALKREAVTVLARRVLHYITRNPEDECNYFAINTLVGLLENKDYRPIVVETLEKISPDPVLALFWHAPSMKLVCAYMRAKGLNEDEIKRKLMAWNCGDNYYLKVVISVILAANRDELEEKAEILDFVKNQLYSNEGYTCWNMLKTLQEYPKFVEMCWKEFSDLIQSKLRYIGFVGLVDMRVLRQLTERDLEPQQQLAIQHQLNGEVLRMFVELFPEIIFELNASETYREMLPAKYLLSDSHHLNFFFDKFLPLLDLKEELYLQMNGYDFMWHYVEQLSVEQLSELLEKIKKVYPDKNFRSERCDVLLSKVENLCNLKKYFSSIDEKSYFALLPSGFKEHIMTTCLKL